MNDKKHLHPNEVWIHWGSTGKELALVATEEPVLGVTCTRFVRATRGTQPEQLSDEERQVVELVRLMRQSLKPFDHLSSTFRFAIVMTRDGPMAMEDGVVMEVHEAIELLRSRLAPKPQPQRPTVERTIAAIRAFLEVADSQDIEEQDELQRVLDDWDAAQGGEQ